MTCSDKPTHTLGPGNVYNAGQVRLYGIALSGLQLLAGEIGVFNGNSITAGRTGATIGSIDAKELGTIMLLAQKVDGSPLSCGIIFGYAFEGHCYDMPKPKLMLLDSIPCPIQDDDCGYSDKPCPPYFSWVVDKLERCLEMELNQGFIEQVVLEANLPGKRAPTSYAGKQFMSHRGGKLTE